MYVLLISSCKQTVLAFVWSAEDERTQRSLCARTRNSIEPRVLHSTKNINNWNIECGYDILDKYIQDFLIRYWNPKKMPRDHSNTRCNNCRAYGHLKKACPLLETIHVGGIAFSNEMQNKPSTSHKKTQETSNKEALNRSSRSAGSRQGGYVSVIRTNGMASNIGGNKNSSSKNQNNAQKYSQEDSDSDDGSLNLNYCSICETNEHDDMECLQEETLAYFRESDLHDKYAKEMQNKLANPNKKTQKSSKEDDCKILILTEQNPALAPYHECDLCDEYGHYEYDCPLYIQARNEQEEYDENWGKRWSKKIKENKKLLQSMAKQSESGMQCEYCYNIHHDTKYCYLTAYDVKGD